MITTNKKKQQFVAPAIRLVNMQTERSIMAASGETPTPSQTGFKTEGLHYGGQLVWD